MPSHSPLVSVIIPVFNGERYLAAALASVAAQDYRPLEVIIVDDGSTDGAAAIATDFLLHSGLPGHYHYQHNQGPATARNQGLALATGAWVAPLDADDLWLPEKTTRQMKVLAEHPHAGVAWGDAITFSGDSPPIAMSLAPAIPAHPRFLLQSMLFRREILETIGPFDPNLRLGEDVDWFLRALEQDVAFVIHPNPVVYYRRHDMNLTRNEDLTRRSFHTMIKRSLDRRRTQGATAGDRPSSLLMLPRPGLNRRKFQVVTHG